MTDIKTKAQAVMEQFLWEPKFSKRDEKLALIRALKEVVKQFGYTHLYVDGGHGLGVVNIRDIMSVIEELEKL
jgi:pyridoxine 5'-phosphate synthase PdxJ